jgi:hypothetical protein
MLSVATASQAVLSPDGYFDELQQVCSAVQLLLRPELELEQAIVAPRAEESPSTTRIHDFI